MWQSMYRSLQADSDLNPKIRVKAAQQALCASQPLWTSSWANANAEVFLQTQKAHLESRSTHYTSKRDDNASILTITKVCNGCFCMRFKTDGNILSSIRLRSASSYENNTPSCDCTSYIWMNFSKENTPDFETFRVLWSIIELIAINFKS
jgi:hypothetical protein